MITKTKRTIEPKIEVVVFDTKDIITTSGDNPIEMEEIEGW